MLERTAFFSVVRDPRNDFWVTIARGSHPFPSRTRQLSPSAPMVLHAQVCGRVGRRPIKYNKRPGRKIGPFAFSTLEFMPLTRRSLAKTAALAALATRPSHAEPPAP